MTAYTAHGAPTRTHTAHNLGKSSLFNFVVSIAKAGGVRYICTLASDYRLGIAKMGGAA